MTGNVHITEGSRLLILLNSLRGTIYLGLAQTCGVLAGFGIQAAIARWAGGDVGVAVGQYGLVIGCMMLTTGTLTLPGLGGAIQQSAARGYDGVLRRSFQGRIRFGWIGMGALFAAAAYYSTHGDGLVASALMIPAVILPFSAAMGSCGNFFRGRSLFGRSAVWEASSKLFNASAVAVTLLLTHNIVYAIWAYFIALLAGNTAGYLWARSLVRNDEIDDGYLRFGYHLSVMTFVATLELYADRLILPAFTSKQILGIYLGAVIIHNQFRMLVLLVAQTLHPRFSRCDGVRPAARMLAKIIGPVFLVVASACGLLWWLAPTIVRIIYNDKLSEAVPYARILILAGVLFTPSILMRTVLTAQRCIKQLYIYDFTFPLAQVAGWIIGAKYFSLDGMIWARVGVLAAAQVLMFALLLHAMRSRPQAFDEPRRP